MNRKEVIRDLEDEIDTIAKIILIARANEISTQVLEESLNLTKELKKIIELEKGQLRAIEMLCIIADKTQSLYALRLAKADFNFLVMN